MPIKTPTPTQDQINQLRKLFIDKYEQTPPADPFHPVDIERVRNEDLWCMRFLEMYDLDMAVSFEKLWDTCIWRKQYGAYDLSDNTVRKDYLDAGVVFPRNKDRDGKPLLIFKTILHTKGSKDMDEIMRCVVYWIERIHRDTHMEQITVVFDLDRAGLSNLDLDFVKNIIETFKLYYPNALNYILIFEMHWVLNAVFKIIKGLLPAKALEILKMISKKDISTYIDKDNCLASWGGNDNYEFSFVPEAKQTPLAVKVNGEVPETEDDPQNNQNKKVHFANSSPTRVPQMTDLEEHFTPQDHEMLRITPDEYIVFSRNENSESFVELKCTSKFPVTYKIQTTSPDKFRVRPRCGVLNYGDTTKVSILLKPEHHLSEMSKDKFLVMCLPVPDGIDTSTTQQLTELWKQKQTSTVEVEQHRLCCVYKSNTDTAKRNGYGPSGSGPDGKASDISKKVAQLENQLKFSQMMQYIMLVCFSILFGAVAYVIYLILKRMPESDSFSRPYPDHTG